MVSPTEPDAPIDDGLEAGIAELLRVTLAPRLSLVRRLGAGGMGTVYLARDPGLKRLVAVKVLSPELARSQDARTRFEREAESVAAIAHPNVVAVYGVGEMPNGVPYFLMQYVSGRSVSERVATDGPFDVDTGRRIIGEVASALAAAHALGIIHRDIKPANILIDDASGRAVVSDFGIAAVLSRDSAQLEAAQKLTQTGTSVGTPAYMSPEQLLAEPVTDKTDIYSMGLLGYELLTGRGAYNIKSPAEIMAAHLRDAPVKLSSLVEGVDPELEALLEACLAKNADDRPAASDVAQRLVRGAGVVLDWPPPGLEPVHGKATKAVRFLCGGALLLGIPFLILVGSARGSFWHSLLPSAVFLSAIAAVGTALYVTGAVRLLRAVRYGGRAVRAGHGWMTVIEVLLDRLGDTGALIAGAREFAGLNPAERTRLRRRRVISGAALLVAAVMPVVGVIVLLPVMARLSESIGSQALVWSVASATAAALAITFAMRLDEIRRLRTTRLRLRREAPPPEVFSRLAKAWRASFEQARRGQSLGAGMGHRRSVGASMIGFTVLVIACSLLGYGMASLSVVGDEFARTAQDLFGQTAVRFAVSNQMRPYRVPVDSTITPERAGQALHAISSFGRPPRAHERASAQPIAGVLVPVDTPPEFPATPTLAWTQVALQRARLGLKPAERRALEKIANNPARAEFAVLARARAADYGAAAWLTPEHSMTWTAPLAENVRRTARAELAQAALDLADGKTASAETRAKSVIGAGFATMDGRTMIEALVGSVIVDMGRDALLSIYNSSGRSSDAEVIIAGVTSALRTASRSGSQERLPASQALDSARRVMRNPAATRGVRWEYAVFRLPYSACADLHQLIFGMSKESREAYAATRPTLVQSPLDSMLFDEAEHALDRPEAFPGSTRKSHLVLGLARVADALVGGRRFESCWGAFAP